SRERGCGRGRPGSGTAHGSRSNLVNTRLTLAAAVATVLASIALYPLLDSGGWFWGGIGAVIVVAIVGAATRRRAIPAVLCFLAAVGGLFLYLNVVFAGRQSWAGLVPTRASLHPSATAAQAGHDRDVQVCAAGPGPPRDRAADRGRDRLRRGADRCPRGTAAPARDRRAPPARAVLRAADHRRQPQCSGRDA